MEPIEADGTVFTSFLATLNTGASRDGGATTVVTGCFVNHCDWRLPSIIELQGIVDQTQGSCDSGSAACIDPTFGPTQSSSYWSATIFSNGFASTAWGVDFLDGNVDSLGPKANNYVRAVRSGL